MDFRNDLIAKNITRYRLKARLNKKQLAELTGLNANYISLIENGKNKTPSMTALCDIADSLHIGVDQLLIDNLSCYANDHLKRTIDSISDSLKHLDDEKLSFILTYVILRSKMYTEDKQ